MYNGSKNECIGSDPYTQRQCWFHEHIPRPVWESELPGFVPKSLCYWWCKPEGRGPAATYYSGGLCRHHNRECHRLRDFYFTEGCPREYGISWGNDNCMGCYGVISPHTGTSWWRHDMEIFPTLLSPLIAGSFSSQKASNAELWWVTCCRDVKLPLIFPRVALTANGAPGNIHSTFESYDVAGLNKLLNKPSSYRRYGTPWRSCCATVSLVNVCWKS